MLTSSFSNEDDVTVRLDEERDESPAEPRSRPELFLDLSLDFSELVEPVDLVVPLKLANNSDLVIKPSLSASAPAGGRRIFLVSALLSFPSLSSSYCLTKLSAYLSYLSVELELEPSDADLLEADLLDVEGRLYDDEGR